MGNHPSSEDNIAMTVTLNDNVDANDDVFVDHGSSAQTSTDDVTELVLRRPHVTSPRTIYRTPPIVSEQRPQIDAALRQSSPTMMKSSSSLDLSSSFPRRSSFSTSSSGYNFSCRPTRSMSVMSLADSSMSTSDDDPDGARRPSFRRQESLFESMARERQENISLRLRKLREAAPAPSSRVPPSRRTPPSPTDDKRDGGGAATDAPPPSRPSPVKAMPMILPRSMSYNMVLQDFIPGKKQSKGSGSGPMRALGVPPFGDHRKFSSSSDDRSEDVSSKSVLPQKPRCNFQTPEDSRLQTSHQVNPHSPRVSDTTPTWSSSAHGLRYPRPLWRTASLDTLVQISNITDDNKSSTIVATRHEPEEECSAVDSTVERSRENEHTTNTEVPEVPEVPDQQPVAVMKATLSDIDRSSSPPPPPPPSCLLTETLEESVQTRATDESGTVSGDLTATTKQKHNGDLFEDVGEAVTSPSIDGDRATIPRPGFSKPRPPLARRSRSTRSQSPNTTIAEVAAEERATEHLVQIWLESRVRPVSDTSDEVEPVHPRSKEYQEYRLSSTDLSNHDPSSVSVTSRPPPDVGLNSVVDVTDHRGETNKTNGNHTKEIDHQLNIEDSWQYSPNYTEDADFTRTANPDNSNEAPPSWGSQLTDESGIFDVESPSPVVGSVVGLNDIQSNGNEVRSSEGSEMSEQIDDSFGFGELVNDKLIENGEKESRPICDESKSTPIIRQAAVLGVTDQQRLTAKSMVPDDLLLEPKLLDSQNRTGLEAASDSTTRLFVGHAIDDGATLCSSGLDDEKVASINSTDEEYVSADDEVRSNSPAEGFQTKKVSWSTLDQVEIFDNDNEERRVSGIVESPTETVRVGKKTPDDERQASTKMSNGHDHCETSVTTKSIVDDGYEIRDFILRKDCVGIGFCIVGGDNAISGRRIPITIKRMFKGETWAKGMLQAGDEIISVNGQSFGMLSHYDAWDFLKSVPDGLVHMTIGRHVHQ